MEQFIELICRLDNIKQWEERDTAIHESVAEHSFKSGAIAVYLSKVLPNDTLDTYVFLNECIAYSLMHDFDEAILRRDISHVLKYNEYNGSSIRSALDAFVDREISLKFRPLEDLMKPTNDVKLFCKMIDWFCLLIFIQRNENIGCNAFQSEKEYCIENLIKKKEEVIEMYSRRFEEDIKKELNKVFKKWIQ